MSLDEAMLLQHSNTSLLASCGDTCGWFAAMYSLLCYGTYGVPIKYTLQYDFDIHPLIFQSYKTFVVFIMSPMVIFLGIQPSFTYWGLLSGILWVIGGTGGVLAVRWAGMALAIGVWASVMMAVNFVWGILIFQEPVASRSRTLFAFVFLTVGLIGMSRFGCHDDANNKPENGQANEGGVDNNRSNGDDDLLLSDETAAQTERLLDTPPDRVPTPLNRRTKRDEHVTATAPTTATTTPPESMNMDQLMNDDDDPAITNTSVLLFSTETHTRVCGGRYILSKRMVGVAAAVFNGLMAGSALIPIHYAKRHGFGGANYMISYAIGSFIANLFLWLLYYVVLLVRIIRHNKHDDNDQVPLSSSWEKCILQASESMPDWHIQQLWKPGLCAGFLIATATFGSILSVTYLGQGIGNSIIQAKIIVSGMWGIFYYKEITNPTAVRRWFLSASVSVLGIIWLSRERIAAKGEHHHRVLATATADESFLIWLLSF